VLPRIALVKDSEPVLLAEGDEWPWYSRQTEPITHLPNGFCQQVVLERSMQAARSLGAHQVTSETFDDNVVVSLIGISSTVATPRFRSTSSKGSWKISPSYPARRDAPRHTLRAAPVAAASRRSGSSR